MVSPRGVHTVLIITSSSGVHTHHNTLSFCDTDLWIIFNLLILVYTAHITSTLNLINTTSLSPWKGDDLLPWDDDFDLTKDLSSAASKRSAGSLCNIRTLGKRRFVKSITMLWRRICFKILLVNGTLVRYLITLEFALFVALPTDTLIRQVSPPSN